VTALSVIRNPPRSGMTLELKLLESLDRPNVSRSLDNAWDIELSPGEMSSLMNHLNVHCISIYIYI
jgi:hypothetical protein